MNLKTAEKNTTSSLQRSSRLQPGQPFLQKDGAGAFFSETTYRGLSPFGSTENNQPFFSPSNIQAKLTIGQPEDPYEQEADRTANEVVDRIQTHNTDPENRPLIQPKSRISPVSTAVTQLSTAKKETPQTRGNPTSPKLRPAEEEEPEKIQPEIRKMAGPEGLPVSPPDDSPEGNPSLQLKCAACESAAKEDEETPDIRKKSIPGAGEQTASSDLESRLNSTKGSGSPLPDETRSSMESAMGADFSGVRVHTNSGAVQMNRELGAQAFTHGSDIYFNSGKYDPQSRAGQGLLAHELVHTVQQTSELNMRIQRNCDSIDPAITSALGGESPATEEFRARIQQLTDEQKSQIRNLIHGCAEQRRTELLEGQSTALNPQALAFRRGIRTLCVQGIQNIRNYRVQHRQEASERSPELALREQDLQMISQVIDNNLVLWFIQSRVLTEIERFYDAVRDIGNPDRTYGNEDLNNINYEIFIFNIALNNGAEAFILRQLEDEIYAGLGIHRSDLRAQVSESEEPEEQGNGGSTGSSETLDPEDLSELSEFYQEVEDARLPTEDTDPTRALEIIREMSDQERQDFLEFYRATATSDENPTTLAEALERYHEMSELDREIMRTNRELSEENPESPGMSEGSRTRLNLSGERSQVRAETAQQANDIMDQIRANIRSNHANESELLDQLQGLNPFGEETYLFYKEMAILDGLLAGASERSPQIRQVAIELRREIDNFDQILLNEMTEIMAELILWQAVTAATEGLGALFTAARMVILIRRIDKLRRLYVRVRQILGIVETIRGIIQTIEQLGEAYNSFRQQFETNLRRFQALERRLSDLDSPEDLEDETEQLREELIEQIQSQLDGRLGELLENFYISEEDAEDEERLMAILLDIPAGIDELQRVMDRYNSVEPGENPRETTGVLGVMAVNAGSKLYPLVGFLATIAHEELSQLNREATPGEFFERFVDQVLSGRGRPGIGRHRRTDPESRRQRRQRNRGFFSRFRPNRYWYPPGAFNAVLTDAVNWMRPRIQNLDRDENISFGGFWTRAWFRRKAREVLRDLNRHRRVWRVDAREGGRNGVAVRVPPPRFRIEWPSLLNRQGPLSFRLKINPVSREQIVEDRLNYNSFQRGIRLNTGDRTRTRALVSWLEDQNYFLQENINGRNFIRHMSRGGGPGSGARREFLQIRDGMVLHDRDLSITKAAIDGSFFLNREVNDDADLPEGYVLHPEGVRRRNGQRPNLARYLLGIDDNGNLVRVEAEGSFPVTQTRTEIHEIQERPIVNPLGMIEEMFENDSDTPKPDYNTQNKTRTQWRRLINNQPHLRQRPVFLHATLGNVQYGRAFGDLLGNRHLPELKFGDDKGHLIAKRFGGSDDYENLTPMQSTINRTNRRGSWYFEEAQSATQFRRGHQRVEVEISVFYPNSRTRRPHRFSIRRRVVNVRDRTTGGWTNLRRRITQ